VDAIDKAAQACSFGYLFGFYTPGTTGKYSHNAASGAGVDTVRTPAP